MVDSLKRHWWKILSILILLYVFIAGFIVPLKPGVLSVSPLQIPTGQSSELEIVAYNSHFDETEEHHIEAYIKLDSIHILRATETSIIGRKRIRSRFNIPNYLPNNETFSVGTLILYDPIHGYMVTPSAVTMIADSVAVAGIGSLGRWDNEIKVHDVPWRFAFPYRGILYETIRNTFFHVAIWMAMFVLLIVSLIYSIKYLKGKSLEDDAVASSFTQVAIGFGLIGMATGSVWAKTAWGAYWPNDPKLNMSVVALMIYMAYAILRSSFTGDDRRAQVSAAYNIFAFCAMIPLIFIIPRLTSSLHPGNGGNPALGGEDLDNTLRMIFYPAIIGLTLLGVWISSLLYRVRKVELKTIEQQLTN